MSLQSTFLGPVFILISAIGFGTGGTIQALAPDEATPYVVVAVRTLIGGLFLFCWCFYRNKIPRSFEQIPLRWVLLASFCMIVATLSFFTGVSQIGVAAGSLISTGITPVWAAIIAFAIFRKIPHAEWYFATILAVAGVILINGIGEIPRDKVFYLHLLILNGFAYACYICVMPKVIEKLEPEVATMLIISIVGICFIPMYFFFPSHWIVESVRGLSVALALGIITAGIAYTCLAAGLQYTSPSVAATLGLAEPMVAAILGIFLLGEPASVRAAHGIGLIFLSVITLTYFNNRRARLQADAAKGSS